jgi:hypothetical protein
MKPSNFPLNFSLLSDVLTQILNKGEVHVLFSNAFFKILHSIVVISFPRPDKSVAGVYNERYKYLTHDVINSNNDSAKLHCALL